MGYLSDMVAKYNSIAEALRAAICKEIDAIPDNPDARQLGNGCFVLRSSAIFNSPKLILSPQYYDFGQQREKLIQVVTGNGSLSSQVERLKAIAESGYITERSMGQSNKFYFHPKVVGALRRILEELDSISEPTSEN